LIDHDDNLSRGADEVKEILGGLAKWNRRSTRGGPSHSMERLGGEIKEGGWAIGGKAKLKKYLQQTGQCVHKPEGPSLEDRDISKALEKGGSQHFL